MSFYNTYVGPAVRYLTYITFLITIVMFGFQLRKIYNSECRIMVFDAFGKPFVPAMIFLILFFWKNINEFVMKSSLVGGDDAPTESDSEKKKTTTPAAPAPSDSEDD